MKRHLVPKNEIKEELRLIHGSNTDYITPSGKVYKQYADDIMLLKKNYINKHNGYLYSTISYPTGQKQRRVHILVAEEYVPNPHNFKIVMHLDNNKLNPNAANLQWGTIAQNTKAAYDDGLIKNDRGWDDNQSIPVCVFDIERNLIEKCGSIGEASRKTGVSKMAILNQCNHIVRSLPRSKLYFRFFLEYYEYGFIL